MITIRKFRKSDIKEIERIQFDTYTGKYIKSDFAKKFLKAIHSDQVRKPTFWVALENGHVRGLGGYGQAWMNWRIYEIFNLNIDPAHQSKGIGTALLKRIIKEIKSKKGRLKEAHLILLTTPRPTFYERVGFKTLMRFRKKEARLMCLNVEKSS